jgi:hypothetical protein
MYMVEVKNCWEFWSCTEEVRSKCPVFIQKKGHKCWEIKGSCSNWNSPRKIMKIRRCKDCAWYKCMHRKSSTT